jgi:hypothetical protein
VQVVYLPIWLIGSIFITEISQNDNGVLKMSELNDYLCWLLSGHLICRLLPCLDCDGILAIHPTILPRYVNPTPEQAYLNLKFALEQQCIKHVFGDHWARFKCSHCHIVFIFFDSKDKVQRQDLLSCFMLICITALIGLGWDILDTQHQRLRSISLLMRNYCPHLPFSWVIPGIFG